MGKQVHEILIDRFLKEVEKQGTMPWQRPYECYNSFNYFSMQTYRGFNRLLLPFGEYMTANQIRQYNKEHDTDYRFQKGIQWYPVAYFNKVTKDISFDEVSKLLPDLGGYPKKSGYIGHVEGYAIYYDSSTKKFLKTRSFLRYYEVADRHYFKNSKGEILPSRIEQGKVEITKSEPMKVIDNYVDRSGVSFIKDYTDVPCYVPALDRVCLNPYHKDETSWFATAFHELAHSTGARRRLNRQGITYSGVAPENEKKVYAEEECIAEITAYLCCAECGVYDFKTSGTAEFQNNVAYVQYWKERIKDFGKGFMYICSQADKAFNYILNENEEI